MNNELRIVISGGGTGGHIFPAVSIANAVKALRPDAKILFVGALGRMEMERVPREGYEIVGLPVRGLIRPLWSPRNIGVLMDFLRSKRMVRRTIRDFRPMAAVGVGGYASAATLKAAHSMGIPCLIQEQNSYAGVTNKMLAAGADRICVAYDGMERFFPAGKLMKTGNPVRQSLIESRMTPAEARRSFGLNPEKRTIVLVGGSLGARTVNESVLRHLDMVAAAAGDVQFVWQTGKYYSEAIARELAAKGCPENLHVTDFITDMGAAYRAADLVISRAGASSISEFCLIGKPVILVPSPNVAEDHQTKNAMALVDRGAAICVKDADAPDTLLKLALETVADSKQLARLSENILKMALPDSAGTIAREVIRLAEGGK